jgi:predicted transcriptional regulator YdeE
MAYWEQRGAEIRPLVDPSVMYEVHVEQPETAQTGEVEVFAGVEVARLDETPIELVAKVLPATRYAVFTLRGAEIAADWNQGMSDWMARAGYRRAFPYGFQRYDERFKGVDDIEGSVLEAYVPVIR